MSACPGKLFPVQLTQVELELRILHRQRLRRAVVVKESLEPRILLEATREVALEEPVEGIGKRRRASLTGRKPSLLRERSHSSESPAPRGDGSASNAAKSRIGARKRAASSPWMAATTSAGPSSIST